MTSYPIIVICGPTGVGKTTIVKILLSQFPEIKTSVTYTTRPPRENSTEDKKMYHVTREEFETRKDAGEFLEWAHVHNDYYGTHEAETMTLLETNPVIFNVDIQGMQQLKERYGDKVISIFLAPESIEQLILHIKKRGDMSEHEFTTRLQAAQELLEHKHEFDHIVVNYEGKIDQSLEQIIHILEPYLPLDKKDRIL